jgi:hypothetical protein
MIRRFTRLKCVEHIRFVHGQTNCIFRPLLFLASATTGILVDPDILLLEGLCLLLLLLRLLIALISWTLATAGTPLFFLHGRYLCRSIPVIWPIISPFIPVISAIGLPDPPTLLLFWWVYPCPCESRVGCMGSPST